uniref:HERV-H LTR-associating 2 n=1 Tax=Nothoprocta perdicaria TaxID=30464 RepID=A0A8C6ZCP1_NOTPE
FFFNTLIPLSLILVTGTSLSLGNLPQLKEQKTVTGHIFGDSVLPCFFPRGNDVVIYWKKKDKNVHSYYYQRDQLGVQDTGYRNRTLLFHGDIGSGNASLKLRNLTFADEGLYQCYVGTILKVFFIFPDSPYRALEYQKTGTERRLRCFAFLTYSMPNITWTRGNVSIPQAGVEESRVGILRTVRSDQDITNPSVPYRCHIGLRREEWAAEWKMEGSDQLACIHCASSPAEHVSVVWTMSSNGGISVLASYNGTSRSYQPRARINTTDFALMLSDLSAGDSGEYLCNISTPRYTKLVVRSLHVGKESNEPAAANKGPMLAPLAWLPQASEWKWANCCVQFQTQVPRNLSFLSILLYYPFAQVQNNTAMFLIINDFPAP